MSACQHYGLERLCSTPLSLNFDGNKSGTMFCCRVSRSERSGRYGSEQSRDEGNWRDRRDRDQDRGYDSHRWGDDRRSDRHGDGERWWGRDSPEVGTLALEVCVTIMAAPFLK